MTFWQKPCYYCQYPIKTIGIDRIDNLVGYTTENCRPTCMLCNRAKNNLTEEKFFEMCRQVVLTHKLI